MKNYVSSESTRIFLWTVMSKTQRFSIYSVQKARTMDRTASVSKTELLLILRREKKQQAACAESPAVCHGNVRRKWKFISLADERDLSWGHESGHCPYFDLLQWFRMIWLLLLNCFTCLLIRKSCISNNFDYQIMCWVISQAKMAIILVSVPPIWRFGYLKTHFPYFLTFRFLD